MRHLQSRYGVIASSVVVAAPVPHLHVAERYRASELGGDAGGRCGRRRGGGIGGRTAGVGSAGTHSFERNNFTWSTWTTCRGRHVGGERLVVKRPLLHTSHMEAQGARVVRHVLTCPVTRGQVAYDACSSCVSHVGVREAGVVRHLLTCPVTRGQMAYDTCSTCQCFLFWDRPWPSREGSCVRRMTHVGWTTCLVHSTYRDHGPHWGEEREEAAAAPVRAGADGRERDREGGGGKCAMRSSPMDGSPTEAFPAVRPIPQCMEKYPLLKKVFLAQE